MNSIEKLRKFTKIKLIVMCLSTLLPILIVVFLSIFGSKFVENSIFDLAPYVPPLITVCFETWIVYKITKYIRILTNESYANKQLVAKNDERNKFIHLKANALLNKIFLYILGVVTIFTAFTDRAAFYYSTTTLLAFLVTGIVVNFYYHRKY